MQSAKKKPILLFNDFYDKRRIRQQQGIAPRDDMFHADRGGSISVRGRIGSPHRAAVELLLGQVGQTDGQTDGRIAASLNAPLRRGRNNTTSR